MSLLFLSVLLLLLQQAGKTVFGLENGESAGVPSTVCTYLECTSASSESLNYSHTIIRYDADLWAKQQHAENKKEFDFRAWNWTELDSIPVAREEKSEGIEVIFNGLETLQIYEFGGHDSVYSLNLAGNEIQEIEKNAFSAFRRLQHLTLRGNGITDINHGFFARVTQLKRLDLSQNAIKTLVGFRERTWSSLTHLNLSHNGIEHISIELLKLESLVWLDLSHNLITRPTDQKSFFLPRNLRSCNLNHNQLHDWPFDSVPTTLTELSVRSNRINVTKAAYGVQSLDLSHNRLSVFRHDHFPALEVLDLSANYFASIPEWIGAEDGQCALQKVYFSKMPYLRAIKRDAFRSAVNLTELEITTCPELSVVDDYTFASLKALTRLDLSYNNLQRIPQNLARWHQVQQGVNLQGNPLRCDCSMQWFLDRVIHMMMQRKEQHILFPELRCAQPDRYANQRLVQLTLYKNLLCRPEQHINRAGMEHITNHVDAPLWQVIVLVFLVGGNLVVVFWLLHLKLENRRLRKNQITYHSNHLEMRPVSL